MINRQTNGESNWIVYYKNDINFIARFGYKIDKKKNEIREI